MTRRTRMGSSEATKTPYASGLRARIGLTDHEHPKARLPLWLPDRGRSTCAESERSSTPTTARFAQPRNAKSSATPDRGVTTPPPRRSPRPERHGDERSGRNARHRRHPRGRGLCLLPHVRGMGRRAPLEPLALRIALGATPARHSVAADTGESPQHRGQARTADPELRDPRDRQSCSRGDIPAALARAGGPGDGTYARAGAFATDPVVLQPAARRRLCGRTCRLSHLPCNGKLPRLRLAAELLLRRAGICCGDQRSRRPGQQGSRGSRGGPRPTGASCTHHQRMRREGVRIRRSRSTRSSRQPREATSERRSTQAT